MKEENKKVKITCVKNGPARVEGSFTIVMLDGKELELKGPLSLCRCGISERMPLCDGAHKNVVPRHDDRLNY